MRNKGKTRVHSHQACISENIDTDLFKKKDKISTEKENQKCSRNQGELLLKRNQEPIFCINFKRSIIYKIFESLCCIAEANIILHNYIS